MRPDAAPAPLRVPDIVRADARSTVLCRATLGLVVYFEDDGSWARGGAAAAVRALRDEVGPDALTWCTTSLAPEGFALRARELGAFEERISLAWAQRAPRHLFAARLADAPGAPSCEFAYRAADPARGARASYVAVHLPPFTAPAALRRLFDRVLALGPVTSAAAGYRLSWDRAHADALAPHFSALGARFLGVDLSDPDAMSLALATRRLVTVNWLTFVGDALLAGAPDAPVPPASGAYEEGVVVARGPGGVLVVAGEAPTTGDLNTLTWPVAYGVAANLLAPWSAERTPDYWPSALGTAAVGRWLRRFAARDGEGA